MVLKDEFTKWEIIKQDSEYRMVQEAYRKEERGHNISEAATTNINIWRQEKCYLLRNIWGWYA